MILMPIAQMQAAVEMLAQPIVARLQTLAAAGQQASHTIPYLTPTLPPTPTLTLLCLISQPPPTHTDSTSRLGEQHDVGGGSEHVHYGATTLSRKRASCLTEHTLQASVASE